MTTDKIGISRDVVSAIINSAYKYDTIADADRSPVCESLAWVLECPSGNSAAPRHRHGPEGLGYEMIPLLLAGIERSADPVKHPSFQLEVEAARYYLLSIMAENISAARLSRDCEEAGDRAAALAIEISEIDTSTAYVVLSDHIHQSRAHHIKLGFEAIPA